MKSLFDIMQSRDRRERATKLAREPTHPSSQVEVKLHRDFSVWMGNSAIKRTVSKYKTNNLTYK